jgi:hypothetical protein
LLVPFRVDDVSRIFEPSPHANLLRIVDIQEQCLREWTDVVISLAGG